MNQPWQSQLMVPTERQVPENPAALCLHSLDHMLHPASEQQNTTTAKQITGCDLSKFPQTSTLLSDWVESLLPCWRQRSSLRGQLCLSDLTSDFFMLLPSCQAPLITTAFHMRGEERTWSLVQLYQSQGDQGNEGKMEKNPIFFNELTSPTSKSL